MSNNTITPTLGVDHMLGNSTPHASKEIVVKNQMLIVKGPGNVGKSTTVKTGFELLLKSVVRDQEPTSVKYLYLTGREVAAVIKVGAIGVGISTRGDNAEEVERALAFFLNEKCKVVICATRSRGAPYEAAKKFARNILKIAPTEVPKEAEEDASKHESANQAIARKIHSWARKVLPVA